jgi:lipoate-protein ligase B
MKILRTVDLGSIGYEEALSLQRRLVDERHKGEIEDTLLLLEHTPVITIGSSGGEDNLLVDTERIEQAGIEVHRTDRGGNITYHGPGQLVGYPIFDLREHGKDVHLFLRNVEQAIVDCLAEFGITSYATPGYAGVWVGEDKICSIGVTVRRWISYHGFALNVSPNFEHWSFIHPCGLVGKQMTSIEKLTGVDPGMEAVKASVVRAFGGVFCDE